MLPLLLIPPPEKALRLQDTDSSKTPVSRSKRLGREGGIFMKKTLDPPPLKRHRAYETQIVRKHPSPAANALEGRGILSQRICLIIYVLLVIIYFYCVLLCKYLQTIEFSVVGSVFWLAAYFRWKHILLVGETLLMLIS